MTKFALACFTRYASCKTLSILETSLTRQRNHGIWAPDISVYNWCLNRHCHCNFHAFGSSVTCVPFELFIYYHPHPKDGEGIIFSQACLSTWGRGYLCTPAHWSLVLSHGRGVLLFLSLVLSQVLSGEYPLVSGPRSFLGAGGVPQSGPGQGYPLPPGQGYAPTSQIGPGQGTPSLRTVHATDRIRRRRYASCVFTQEDFLVLNK